MLRSASIAMDAVSKANPLEGRGIESMQAMGGNKDLHLVIIIAGHGCELQVGGVAKGVGVFCAEMGNLLSGYPLNRLRKKYELVGKPGCKTCCF